MNLKIAVAYHKSSLIVNNNILLPIHVGKSISKVKLDMQGDDEGDNISHKNPYYCELTALYWLWKNTTADYKGLFHYRRFFTFKKKSVSYRIKQYLRFRLFCVKILLSGYSEEIYLDLHSINCSKEIDLINDATEFAYLIEKKILQDNIDIVATKRLQLSPVCVKEFWNLIGRSHLDLLDNIILEHYSEYNVFYKQEMNGNSLHYANMQVMRNELFNEYCLFVFGVLEKHEQMMLEKNWCSDLQQGAYSRISGYLAELLTSVFISKKKNEGKTILCLNTLFYNQ